MFTNMHSYEGEVECEARKAYNYIVNFEKRKEPRTVCECGNAEIPNEKLEIPFS
jgi:hypothetical protein